MLQWEQMISLLITENIKLSTITPRLWLNICVKDDMKYDLWNAYGMLEGHELSCDICKPDFRLRNGRTDLDKVARVKICRSYFISSARSSYSHSAPMSSSDNLLRFLLTGIQQLLQITTSWSIQLRGTQGNLNAMHIIHAKNAAPLHFTLHHYYYGHKKKLKKKTEQQNTSLTSLAECTFFCRTESTNEILSRSAVLFLSTFSRFYQSLSECGY